MSIAASRTGNSASMSRGGERRENRYNTTKQITELNEENLTSFDMRIEEIDQRDREVSP